MYKLWSTSYRQQKCQISVIRGRGCCYLLLTARRFRSPKFMAFVNKSWNVVEKNVKLHDTKLSTKMYQIHISATMKWLTMIVVAGKQFFEEVGIHFRQHALRANHLVAVTLSTVFYFSALTENMSSAAHFQTITLILFVVHCLVCLSVQYYLSIMHPSIIPIIELCMSVFVIIFLGSVIG